MDGYRIELLIVPKTLSVARTRISTVHRAWLLDPDIMLLSSGVVQSRLDNAVTTTEAKERHESYGHGQTIPEQPRVIGAR